MSRPANASHAVLDFAPDADYPAGGETWSNNPTKVTPAGATSVGFTPGQGNAAQYHNYVHRAWSEMGAASKTKLNEILNFVGQVGALNYSEAVAPGGVLRGALWNGFERKWYCYGDDGIIRDSSTNGWVWNAASVIATPSNETEEVSCGDVDASGNMVFSCTGFKDVFTYVASTFTWAKVGIAGGGAAAFATYPAEVAYDPIRDLWCWIQYDAPLGTPTPRCYTSPDRATWTSRTPPSNLAAPNQFSFKMRSNKTTGRLVWVNANQCATSDDGGVTWTARSNIDTSGTSAADIGCLINKPGTTEWLYITGEVTGTPTCTINKSTDDGATWTPICTLAANLICDAAWVGEMLVATARTTSEVVFSLDGGVTWKRTGFAVSATTRGAYAGDGCAMLIGSGSAYPPFRTGLLTTVNLT